MTAIFSRTRLFLVALSLTVACSSGTSGNGGASQSDPSAPAEDPGAQPPDDSVSGDAGDELTLTVVDDGDDASDAAPSSGRCDPNTPFGAPSPVASVNSTADESSARLSPDELTLYLGTARSGTYDMFVATRETASADFGSPIPLANLSTANQESHGVVTNDGLSMYLGWAKPGAQFQLAVAVRSAVVAEFGAPELLANVNSNSTTALDNDPMLDDEGKNLYFTSTRAGNIDIYRAAKQPSGAFGAPSPIAEVDTAAAEHMPVLAPDGLALYFASNRGGKSDDVWVARRTSASQAFGAPALVAELSSDVDDAPTWVSSDECTIYLRRGSGSRDIFVASRPK